MGTKKQVLNYKTKHGETAFTEACASLEHAIKEAACEFPNYEAIVLTLLEFGVD